MRGRWGLVGAVAGAALTFIAIDAIDELFKVTLGAALGWIAGVAGCVLYVRKHRQQHVVDLQDQSKSELLIEARDMGIAGTSGMTKDQLAAAITAEDEADDPAGSIMQGLADEAAKKVGDVVEKTRAKVVNRDGRSGGKPTQG
jgi:hypothetical protein